MSNNIAKSAYSRVFVISGRARADHIPEYKAKMRMTGLSQGFGDIERVEAPDPNSYGKFIPIAEIRGATERATTTLENRYGLDIKSSLMELAREGCSFDVQLHFGACTNPNLFNVFQKALILESVFISNLSTDDLGALQSDENAVINESADITAERFYEVLPLSYARQADSIITNEIVDVAVCDAVSCGECEDQSDGCSKFYAITGAAGGSPSTPADVIFSPDKGAHWYAHDIDSLGAAEAPTAVDCLADYLVIVSNDSNSIHYAPLSSFDGSTDPVFTEVVTGFVVGGEPNDLVSINAYAFIVGDGGYIYGATDPTEAVSVLDPGSATADDLLAVDAYSEEIAVAVGRNGAVVYTENGVNWTAAITLPVGAGVNLNCVMVKSKTEWFVGTSAGKLFYTVNKGGSWTEIGFSGSGTGSVEAIDKSTDSVMWMSHTTAAGRGRMFVSYDGGQSWRLEPNTGTLPLADRINAIAVCEDPNFVFTGGLADDAADGILLLGQASS